MIIGYTYVPGSAIVLAFLCVMIIFLIAFGDLKTTGNLVFLGGMAVCAFIALGATIYEYVNKDYLDAMKIWHNHIIVAKEQITALKNKPIQNTTENKI